MTEKVDGERLVESVRERYGRIAASGGGCCTPPASTRLGYDHSDLEAVPGAADLGLGCGAPIGHLALAPGETVLDLGSGGGLDVFLAAREVGPTGRAIGVDMTPEMIERATANARKAGLAQVEFRHGRLERLPVDDATIDAVTSNCVINLVPDKTAVFREVARVLKPGGRLVISDIVLDGPLPEAISRDLLAYVGCVAGAMRRETYFDTLRSAGLDRIQILVDEDFLDKIGPEPPEELRELVRETGIEPESLRGIVRSVTYRALKR